MGNILTIFVMTLSLLCCHTIVASSIEFKVGDVILIDLDCPSCQVIEDETFGPYSHSGLIVEVNNKLYVSQALGDVHHLKIETFLSFSTKPGLHLRPINIKDSQRQLLNSLYSSHYYKLIFDHSYLWDDETLYCAEYIYKVLDDVLKFKKFGPKPMNYQRNWEFWTNYFGHTPPQGELGLSPNDFYKSDEFLSLGFIY